MALLIFFEISKEMHFVSLFFVNARNITTTNIVHYASLNPSPTKKPYLRAVEYTISGFIFFSISYLYLF